VKILPLDQIPNNEVKQEVRAKGATETRTLKRKRTDEVNCPLADDDDSDEDAEDIAFVKVSRNDLLKMSSAEFDGRVKALKQQRPLTAIEEAEVKRQKKLIKNREYAQKTRDKKRKIMTSMKGHVTDVEHENVMLKVQVQNLTTKVHVLEQENLHLKLLLGRVSPAAMSVPAPINQLPVQTAAPMYAYTGNYEVPTVYSSYPSSPTNSSSAPNSPQSPSSPGSPISSVEDYEFDQFLGPFIGTDSQMIDMSNDNPLALSTGSSNNSGAGNLFNDILSWSAPTTVFTTGLCLLVILFSFGLFIGLPDVRGPLGLPDNFNFAVDSSGSTARGLRENNNDASLTPDVAPELYMPGADGIRFCSDLTRSGLVHKNGSWVCGDANFSGKTGAMDTPTQHGDPIDLHSVSLGG